MTPRGCFQFTHSAKFGPLPLLCAFVIGTFLASATFSQGLQAPTASPAVANTPDAETALRDAITAQVAKAWQESDFSTLEFLADDYAQTQARTLSGKWRLAVFHGALNDLLEIPWPEDGYLMDSDQGCRCKRPIPSRYRVADPVWDALHVKVQRWIDTYPASAHARIVLAQYNINRAWFYRGSGMASSVPVEAWPRVGKYIQAARVAVESCPEGCRADPHWFEVMFFIASAQSWTAEQIDALIHELLDCGLPYVPAYQSAARMLLPQWGGSYEAVEDFARMAMAKNAKTEGTGIYTRIYWNLGVNLFQFSQTKVDWATMKRGFEEILAKYPDPRNLNGEAMFACAARDADTFHKTMKELGTHVLPSIWLIDTQYCIARFERS